MTAKKFRFESRCELDCLVDETGRAARMVFTPGECAVIQKVPAGEFNLTEVAVKILKPVSRFRPGDHALITSHLAESWIERGLAEVLG